MEQGLGPTFVTAEQYNVDPSWGSCEMIVDKLYALYLEELPIERVYYDFVIFCMPLGGDRFSARRDL